MCVMYFMLLEIETICQTDTKYRKWNWLSFPEHGRNKPQCYKLTNKNKYMILPWLSIADDTYYI